LSVVLAELSFGQTIVVELLKAVFTAVFVAGVAAFLVSRYQNRAEANRAELETHREDAAKERERRLQIDEAKRGAKTRFVNRCSELGGSFYFSTQRYWRQKGTPEIWGPPEGGELDLAYVAWATSSEALEIELRSRYGWDADPPRLWHQVRDLLTVRYFDLRDRNKLSLREKNEKRDDEFHSGLTAEQLEHENMGLVLSTYRDAMRSLAKALLDSDISV
jgi:hypothetical protein